jgi:hypothetical protein
MYLHIGRDTVIRADDIIGIFDIENTSVSPVTREYLAGAQTRGEVVNVTNELPKSFVVCAPGRKEQDGETSVYISQISVGTLCKRADGAEGPGAGII